MSGRFGTNLSKFTFGTVYLRIRHSLWKIRHQPDRWCLNDFKIIKIQSFEKIRHHCVILFGGRQRLIVYFWRDIVSVMRELVIESVLITALWIVKRETKWSLFICVVFAILTLISIVDGLNLFCVHLLMGVELKFTVNV